MDVRLHRAGIELDARRFLTLDDAVGTRIVCVAGELWITQHRDTSDHLLREGGCFTVDAPGKVVIQAQRPARIALIEPRASMPTHWIASTMRRWFGVARIDSRPNAIAQTHGA